MGFLDFLKDAAKGSGGGGKGELEKCPSCGEMLNLSMERCPKCGVRISSMFRRRCPKCQALNELNIKKCAKCNYDFEAEYVRSKKTTFQCPICGFQSDGYLTSCPVCNTRFI